MLLSDVLGGFLLNSFQMEDDFLLLLQNQQGPLEVVKGLIQHLLEFEGIDLFLEFLPVDILIDGLFIWVVVPLIHGKPTMHLLLTCLICIFVLALELVVWLVGNVVHSVVVVMNLLVGQLPIHLLKQGMVQVQTALPPPVVLLVGVTLTYAFHLSVELLIVVQGSMGASVFALPRHQMGYHHVLLGLVVQFQDLVVLFFVLSHELVQSVH